MKLFRPQPPARRNGFNVATYLTALQTLGLTPPVDRDTIHRAFRERAKRVHPDRFQDEEEKAVATRRIQEMNHARTYALDHWNGFELDRRWNRQRPRWRGTPRMKPIPWRKWRKWLMAPVTTVYMSTTIAAALLVKMVEQLIGAERLTRWGHRPTRAVVKQLWLLAAPHLITVLVFATVDVLVVRIWFGASFLIMFAADVWTLVTGTCHTHRAPVHSALTALSLSPNGSSRTRQGQRRTRWVGSRARSGIY